MRVQPLHVNVSIVYIGHICLRMFHDTDMWFRHVVHAIHPTSC